MKDIVVAAIQMSSGEDKATNLKIATALIEQAAQAGAKLVALPELFNCLGRFEVIVAGAEPIPGPTSEHLSRLAARLNITVVAGSICEAQTAAPAEPGSERCFNTSMIFSGTGERVATYRKMHLFDVELPDGVRICESKFIRPGTDVVTVQDGDNVLGLATCYDLRFPELFRSLADRGADVIVVPSAFTRPTGRDHWEVLVRARAIENQAFVIAPNQCGRQSPQLLTYGNSMIVDPWGRILARAADEATEVLIAGLRSNTLREVRSSLPALKHRVLK